MSLKRMSLNATAQPLNYVKSSNKNNPPILKLGDYNLSISYYSSSEIKAERTLEIGLEARVYSRDFNYHFFEMFQNWGVINKDDLDKIESFTDVLILGTLCQALWEVKLQDISIITKHSKLFGQFVNDTLAYYDYDRNKYAKDYTFNVDRALHLVSQKSFLDSGKAYIDYGIYFDEPELSPDVLASLYIPSNLVIAMHIFPEPPLLSDLFASLNWILPFFESDTCMNNEDQSRCSSDMRHIIRPFKDSNLCIDAKGQFIVESKPTMR